MSSLRIEPEGESEGENAHSGQFRYRAFLSYSHTDRRWGRWLLRKLEGYRVPVRLVGQETPAGPVPARLAPIFRDRDELPTSPDLGREIRTALADSAALIVICSPAAAASRWVNEEILTFRRLGRSDRVFCFVVGGEPGGPHETEPFPAAVRFQLGDDGELTDMPIESAAADARPVGDGPKRAFRRLIAGLLGVRYDTLRQRELARRQRRLIAITAASLAGMALTIALAMSAYVARQEAERRRDQADRLISFMVGDLREKLESVGRLEILDSVGDESMRYFASLDPADVTDETLALQAQALTQIGEVRTEQGEYGPAFTAFGEAHRRAVELAQRAPDNGSRLFDRGQAEFWMGYVNHRRGNLAGAEEWWQRYLKTSQTLVEYDDGREDWLRELAYAEHNLAVVQLNRGSESFARDAFGREVALLERLIESNPSDGTLAFDLADAYSWQGTAAERLGELTTARGYFAMQGRQMHRALELAPDQMQWRYDLANAAAHEARLAAILGQRDEARRLLEEAIGELKLLFEHDPENRFWLSYLAASRATLARLLVALGDRETALREADAAADALKVLVETEGSDVTWRRYLAEALLVGADVHLKNGDTAGAASRLERSQQLLVGLGDDVMDREQLTALQGRSLLLLGRVLAAQARAMEAQETWLEAHAVLTDAAAGTSYWVLLDPLARSAARSGQEEQSRNLLARLTQMRYVPLESWPEIER